MGLEDGADLAAEILLGAHRGAAKHQQDCEARCSRKGKRTIEAVDATGGR
jgi:hypothetical protein